MTDHQTVHEALGEVLEAVGRIDERTQTLADMQRRFDENLHGVRDSLQGIATRVAILESANTHEIRLSVTANANRIADLDKRLSLLTVGHEQGEGRWKAIMSVVVGMVQTGIGAYLVWRFGWTH